MYLKLLVLPSAGDVAKGQGALDQLGDQLGGQLVGQLGHLLPQAAITPSPTSRLTGDYLNP